MSMTVSLQMSWINIAVFNFTKIFLNAFSCCETICQSSSTIDRNDNIYNFLSLVFRHNPSNSDMPGPPSANLKSTLSNEHQI